jgi:hypothetical protein
MDYDHNVYYNPASWGMEIFAELDNPNLSYEYETLIVLKHVESGKFYWAHDSGCSCPTPFEDYNKIEDLSVLNRQTFGEFEHEVKHFGYGDDAFPAEKQDLVRRVQFALRVQLPALRSK